MLLRKVIEGVSGLRFVAVGSVRFDTKQTVCYCSYGVGVWEIFDNKPSVAYCDSRDGFFVYSKLVTFINCPLPAIVF